MKELLWLIVALPFAGALILAISGRRFPRVFHAVTGVASVGLSALLTLILGSRFLADSSPTLQIAWQWFDVMELAPSIGFYLDPVSMVFIFIITFVGPLMPLYSVGLMWKEDGFVRFFVYMNLFVGLMLVLVLGGTLPVLYLGWEGAGMCGHLLTGFR